MIFLILDKDICKFYKEGAQQSELAFYGLLTDMERENYCLIKLSFDPLRKVVDGISKCEDLVVASLKVSEFGTKHRGDDKPSHKSGHDSLPGSIMLLQLLQAAFQIS